MNKSRKNKSLGEGLNEDLEKKINKVAKKLNFSANDVLYYNVEMPTANQFTCGTLYGTDNIPTQAKANVYNNNIILENPSDYFGSIVRMQFPGYDLPIIGPFLVQTPVNDINKGIYSFTLQYNGINGAQTFFEFVPDTISVIPGYNIPTVGTQYQTFSDYYFLFNYTSIINIMNTALSNALTSLKAQAGTGAIATAKTPFFHYDCITEKISLYADNNFFNGATSTDLIKIFFNNPAYIYLEGIPAKTNSYNDIHGLDSYIYIYEAHSLNLVALQAPDSYQAVVTTQQYVSVEYMCSVKNVTVETNMGTVKEVFNVTQNSQTIGTVQSTAYNAVLTDFLPDFNQPSAGIISYRFTYNANSLYRVFSFNDNLPLLNIDLAFWWYDNYGNKYPLTIEKGENPSVKFMFIKKELLQPLMDGLNQLL